MILPLPSNIPWNRIFPRWRTAANSVNIVHLSSSLNIKSCHTEIETNYQYSNVFSNICNCLVILFLSQTDQCKILLSSMEQKGLTFYRFQTFSWALKFHSKNLGNQTLQNRNRSGFKGLSKATRPFGCYL